MSAIETFHKTIDRAQKMVDLHAHLSPKGKPKQEHADILRAAVVIAVSAMDTYFHEKIPENITDYVHAKKGHHLPGKLIEVIKSSTSHERLIEVFFEERPLSHIVSIVRKNMKDRTYQDAGKIEDALKILGISDLWFQLSKKLRVSKDRSKKYVQGYVERRHQIVHRGDYGHTKATKNKLKPVTRPYAHKCVKEIKAYVEAIDEVINDTLNKLSKKNDK